MKIKPIEELTALLKNIASPLGIEVVEVEFKNGKEPSLTIYIDKEGGVDLDTCEALNNAIDAPLDEFDPTFGEPYTLNVSSLGLDRPFKTDEDFTKNLENEVEIKLFAPIKGVKYLEGVLKAFDAGSIKVDTGKEVITIERNRIAKINKAIKF